MNRIGFFVVSFMIGLFLQIFCDRFLAFMGVGPDLLLLFVLAFGFFAGPVMGEVFGFGWGLALDVMGVTLFGINSFLLSVAGYGAGKLRQRVASERAAAQIAIGLIATIVFGMSTLFLHRLFLGRGTQDVMTHLSIAGFFNILLVRFVFWLVDRWLFLWKYRHEEVEA